MHIDYTHLNDDEQKILKAAANIIEERYIRQDEYTSPEHVKQFVQYRLGHYEREVFAVMLLDNQHRLIEFKEMFFGTIDSAAVYPREVLKAVLHANAAAVIFAHNHPSGLPEPSESDKQITRKLKDALSLIDVRVLDHIVTGETSVSFAERGLM